VVSPHATGFAFSRFNGVATPPAVGEKVDLLDASSTEREAVVSE